MKRKIIAIWIILLLIAIPISIAGASETSVKEKKNSAVLAELATVESDGSLIIKNLQISEEDLAELESAISMIMDQIQSKNDLHTSWIILIW